MKSLFAVLLSLGLFTAIAVADDAPPADAPPADDAAAPPAEPAADCTQLEGQAQEDCVAAQTPPADGEAAGKGKAKLEKSKDNKMESFDNDD